MSGILKFVLWYGVWHGIIWADTAAVTEDPQLRGKLWLSLQPLRIQLLLWPLLLLLFLQPP